MYLFSGVAGPGHVGLAGFERRADRMQAGHEIAVGAERFQHRACPCGS